MKAENKISFQPRKRFGQNFLTNQNIIASLVHYIQPQLNDNIVEIGPGLGALTMALLPHLERLYVVEVDRDLAANLQAQKNSKLIVYEQDALTFNFAQLIDAMRKIRVVGNLPYNISTPLIFHLLSFAKHIHDMHFMLQKEVVDRMAAQPGSKAFGRLSVMVQYACQVEDLMHVPPNAFYPAPKVNSAFVRLIPYEKPPYLARDFDFFANVVKHAFSQRRKTLKNCLQEIISLEVFHAAGIDPALRAEQLSVEDFVRLSNAKF